VPRFLIQRQFGPRDDEVQAIGADSNRIIAEKTPEITWEISHVVADEDGNVTTFCIYQAPSEQIILEHAEALGRHRVDSIYEIGGDIAPADFPI
jgi:Nickel responsive protein SCO4226-like